MLPALMDIIDREYDMYTIYCVHVIFYTLNVVKNS